MAYNLQNLENRLIEALGALELPIAESNRTQGNHPDYNAQGITTSITQENWNKSFPYTFSVEDQSGPVGGFSEFPLPLNPKSIVAEEIPAIHIQPTATGTIIQQGGIRYGNLKLMGTTGLKPYGGASGVNKLTGVSFAGSPKSLKAKSGFEVFQIFKNYIKAYYQYKQETNSKARLIFKNYKDGEFLYVEVKSIEALRTAELSLLYNYTITARIIGRVKATPLAPGGFLSEIGEAADQVLEIANTRNRVISEYRDIFRQVSTTALSLVNDTMRELKLTLNLFTTVETVFDDFSDQVKSSLLTRSIAANFAEIIGEKIEEDRTNGIPSLLSAETLPNPDTITAEQLLQINEKYGVLNEILTSELPENTRRVLDAELDRISRLPKSHYLNRIQELENLKNSVADFYGIGASTFDQINRRTSQLAGDSAELTDAVYYLLQDLDKTIEGIESFLLIREDQRDTYEDSINTLKNSVPGNLPEVQTAVASREIIVPYNSTLERIAVKELGDYSRWVELATLNGLSYPYISDTVFFEDRKVLKSGDTLLVPIAGDSGFSNLPRGKDTALSTSLNEVERNLGVDLKLSNDRDLILNGANDFDISYGLDNAAQAIMLKLAYEKGDLLEAPEIGVGLKVGAKLENAGELKTRLINSLTLDPRFEKIDNVSVSRKGNLIRVNFSVKIKHVDTPINLAINI